jgi:hypothetical protein
MANLHRRTGLDYWRAPTARRKTRCAFFERKCVSQKYKYASELNPFFKLPHVPRRRLSKIAHFEPAVATAASHELNWPGCRQVELGSKIRTGEVKLKQ